MKNTIPLLLAVLLVLPLAFASPLDSSYRDGFENMVSDALQPQYNTTLNVTIDGLPHLVVPEFTSSTVCGVGQLQAVYNTSAVSMTHHEIRTDIFSEVGIILAAADQPGHFDAWYNTLTKMDLCGYGTLPCWVVLRDGNTITNSSANDTAIDGSVRSWTALFIASQNANFTTANRSKYLSLAEQMADDTLTHEFVSITPIATRPNNKMVDKLPFGGGDCAGFGLGCSTDIWTGYNPTIAYGFQIAYNITGNVSYDQAAQNVTAAFISVALQNDTDGDGFGVSPFNFNWDVTGPVLNHTDGGGVNSYHYNTGAQQWDDSDAPRYHEAGTLLRVENETEQTLRGVYSDLATYNAAWVNTNTLTATTSCLQYGYRGQCGTTVRTGFYENGFGAQLFMYHNVTLLDDKIDETLTHYSGGTYDSTTCGTALSYRGIRPTKSIMQGLNLDIPAYVTPAPSTPAAEEGGSCVSLNGGERAMIIIVIGILLAAITNLLFSGFSLMNILFATIGVVLTAASMGLWC